MTILDVKNQIVEHFLSFEKFSKEDFAGITVSSDLNAFRDEMAISALTELEKAEIVSRIGKETWVLSKPLQYQNQIIEINIEQAARIAATLNAFYKANGLENEIGADVTSITSDDIDCLIDVIDELSDDGAGTESDEEDDDSGENWKN